MWSGPEAGAANKRHRGGPGLPLNEESFIVMDDLSYLVKEK